MYKKTSFWQNDYEKQTTYETQKINHNHELISADIYFKTNSKVFDYGWTLNLDFIEYLGNQRYLFENCFGEKRIVDLIRNTITFEETNETHELIF